jgi:divalent anion:Na+ symporter, DASS family
VIAVQSAAARAAWWRWPVAVVPGTFLYFFSLPGLNPLQGRLLGVFVATIAALVAQPVPMGVSAVTAMTLLAVTRTLPPRQVLSGFGNVTVWLIFTSFLFARAVTATGLGTRIGYLLIRHFARSPLSLGYCIAGADLVLAPFIPSDTARGGGVIYPISRSVASAFGSEPGPTSRLMGAYLILVSFHMTYAASGIYLTGMAANPLIAEFAAKVAHVELTWIRWFSGAIVPGLLTMAVVPWLLLHWSKPQIRDTAAARELARRELECMGPMSRREKWLVAIMIGVMIGWVTSPLHGTSNTFVALAGVVVILLAGVLTWEDLLAEKKAWDALIWFSALLMITEALSGAGVIHIFSAKLFGAVGGRPWPVVLFILVGAYLYVHYGFASMTAQVTVLYSGFLAAAVTAGVPPLIAALPLAYFSNLNAAMTHYGTGSAPIFFGAGYVRQGEWWRVGFLISLVNLAIWMGVGMLWWKAIGLW